MWWDLTGKSDPQPKSKDFRPYTVLLNMYGVLATAAMEVKEY
jgi:hypothetical protein